MRYYTITQFNREFPDDDACLDFMFRARWPEGVSCATCKRVTTHHRIQGRRQYACAACGAHVAPTAGTIFHKSETPLRLWFYAMFLMASTRCGISAKQLQREIGVTYKTAWRMFHQIRKLMADDGGGGPLSGEIEADETYIGGKEGNKHADKKRREGEPDTKAIAFGMVERGGRVIGRVVPNVQAQTVLPIIWRNVAPHKGTSVYTDESTSYALLPKLGYAHKTVNHSGDEYVRGAAHTNTLEGFWSLLKRGINGVYHSVSARHLPAYIDEYAYRYSRRKDSTPMFVSLLAQAAALQLAARRA